MEKNKFKKIIIASLFSVLVTGSLFFLKDLVSAQTISTTDLGLAVIEGDLGLPSTDIRIVVARIIRVALSLLGIVALVLMLYAGFVWMTAGGEASKIEDAKKIMVNAAIGLAIILSAYAITSFVISKLVDATTGGAGSGPGGPGPDGNPYLPPGIFYVDNLPQGGTMCIRNVHLAVTFNRAVNLATLSGNVVVRDTSGAVHPGQWEALGQNTAAFVPNGDCGSGPADCYAPSTTYNLHFQNPGAVRSVEGNLALNCTFRAGCGDVTFTTGNGVDRNPPQVRIEPISSDLLRVGTTVPVLVSYTDDNGVQKVDLSADTYFVGSQTVAGCQSSGSVTINWPTVGINTGLHTLYATGYDWAALNYTTSTNVNLLPQHCFDNVLQADLGEVQAGPPACGGECGACSGTPCTDNTQCASGYCDTLAGVCVDRMRINGVSPLTGGPGTFVSISGNYFGNTPGRVFINNVPAPLAPCGSNSWLPWQIVTEVPAGASTGPIRVETATSTSGTRFTDATNDAFGPAISNFQVDNVVRPGLCGATPANGLPGSETSLSGRRLGNAPGQVSFGINNIVVSLANWADTLVRARVPLGEVGPVAVKVIQNNVESNSVRFFVEQGVSDSVAVISSISPDRGARGTYITITGNNFGNQIGRVWFKENINGQPGDAIDGDFTFPAGCQNTWTNTQIIVKFPLGSGTPGRPYFVQVRPADASAGPSPIGPVFNLENGQPAPGICNLNPVSGPVPFPGAAPRMQIIGEYFGATPAVYFWTEGASPTAITGRVLSGLATATNLIVGQSIDTEPPVGTRTGPVVVFRSSDNQISNPANFSVLDCVRNNNTCTAPNTHCCVSGAEAGLCRPNNQLCAGETITAGYIWRFSTRDIPPVPHVVERCNNNTDLGLNIPSPSPSAQWDASPGDPHHNVCRSATIVTEFNLPNINNIDRANLLVNECQANTIDELTRTCTVAQAVPMAGAGNFLPQLSTENTSYLELNPDAAYNTGKWKDNTWYQVVLKSAISAGAGTSTAFLAPDKPCGPGSSYCFIFRSDTQDCRMRSVVVTPYSYWTSVLEAPIKRRESVTDVGVDVEYSGHGLSTQHCIMMNTAAFNWAWGSRNVNYASIFSSTGSEAKVSALANTVGVGLTNPSNGVYITATATLASVSYNGVSPLTIDLSNPEVVDFWPTCLQSCTNAEVGVRFNTTLSNRNLPGSAVSGPIKLLRCNDENCFNTTPVLSASDVFLDSTSDYRVIKLANSLSGSLELLPNTIYKVVLSVSTTDFNSPELLWSAARLGDPTTFSKPYNKQFSWRFKTKAERCTISRVDVTPNIFTASFINDKKIYNAQPYSSPDTCNAQGQKLNPWSVSWNWRSAQPEVATVTMFTTRGNNPFCTLGCVRRGSSISVGMAAVPICGNGIVEPGENCDSPLRGAGCSLDCRRLGNTSNITCGNGTIDPSLGETCDTTDPASMVGCSSICLHAGSAQTTVGTDTSASICGNGEVGSGEDCDVGATSAGIDTLRNGLMSWWTFDPADVTPTTVLDKSGQGNNGTRLGGVATITGQIGQAMFFDGNGDDDVVSFPTPAVNANTISFWYKTNTLNLPNNHRMAISGSASASGATYVSLVTNGVASPIVSLRIGATQRTLNSGVASVVGKWTHVVANWDGGRIRIYVDGVLRNTSADFSGDSLVGFDGGIGYIGRYQAAPGYEFFGSIDDVRIYNRAISASEINTLYQDGQKGLVGWWTFDDVDLNATQVFDRSGNNNTGSRSRTTVVAGQIGQALEFTSSNPSVVQIPGINIGNTFSFTGWFQFDQDAMSRGASQYIFSSGNGGAWAYQHPANNFLYFYGTGGAQLMVWQPTPRAWHFVACSVVGGTNTTCYGDGELKTMAQGPGAITLTNTSVVLGGGTDGMLDDFRLYNRILSAAEVTAIYQYTGNPVASISPSTGCSQNCLHTGTRLSSNWCFVNNATFGGFVQADFTSACNNAISRCGDGVSSPDEDPGCDLGNGQKASWCNNFCLNNNVSRFECVAGSEGCTANRQNIGSSLLYSVPSLCGDTVAGIGEDAFCETNLSNTRAGVNPWSLVTGVGFGEATGVPPNQKAYITASTNENTTVGSIGDTGQFVIPCVYSTDAECQARMGNGWGVATNGCCYLRPRLLSVTPGNTSTNQFNICPNTAIEAVFNQDMDVGSVINNIVVARGTTSTSCGTGEDVTALALLLDDENDLPWYKKVFAKILNLFKYITGQPASALRTEVLSTRWCAGDDVGRSDIEMVSGTLGRVVFKLIRPLATDTDYFIALKEGIRSKQGIGIGKNNITNKPLGWKFITGERMCEINSVDVDPPQVYFDKVGATSTLHASAYTASSARIQTIPGYYSWEYIWQPVNNSYAILQFTTSSFNTITSENHNGETDIRATAVITSNIYSAQAGAVATGKSHIIVFLCENPWPPKDLYIGTNGPYIIFPYEDKVGNNDGFNLLLNAFNNTAIPSSPAGGYFNFRTYYCADSGAFGTDDDLPYLRPAVQVSASVVADTPTSSLKRFIFSNTKNGDGIGIAVFSNSLHLTVSEWFENDRALGGQGFAGNMQTAKIDGYDALTDGNNIYVDALNYSNASNNLFSNIYLFSINSDAKTETRKVFEQLITNLRFNTNLTNYGYCGVNMANPGASTTCQTDLDCSGLEVCSVQIDKLKRNYIRLRDLGEIQNLLGP